MRTRLVALLGSVWLLLGCMGMVNGLTDLDLDVQIGEEASLPADFPLAAPSTGQPAMFVAMTGDRDSINLPENVTLDLPPDVRFRMELMTYAEAQGVDIDAYTAPLVDAGYTLAKLPDDVDTQGAELRMYESRGTLVVAMVDAAAGTVTLIRVQPVDAATAPAE